MILYEEVEPNYDEKVDREIYEDTMKELEKAENKILGLTDDLEETQADLRAVIETIIEYGNKYSFDEAYPKIYEFLKARGLDEKVLFKKQNL